MLTIRKKCHTVKKVDYVDGYKLKLIFDDRSVKIVDLSDMLKKAKNMLLPLRDLDYFKKVSCDGTTVVWPNGVDFCPDALYSMGEKVPRKTKARKRPSPTARTKKKSKSHI